MSIQLLARQSRFAGPAIGFVALAFVLIAGQVRPASAADGAAASGSLPLPAEDPSVAPASTESVPEKKEATVAGPTSYWPQFLGSQATWIRQFQSPLASPYSGPNSLNPDGDVASTYTVGAYFGWAIAHNLQAYFDIEKFMGSGVSDSVGLGGLTNGDVVRQGGAGLKKRPYVARRYLRYMVPLSSQVVSIGRAQDQIAGEEASTRLEFKVGTMAVTDDFDKNRYANSTRTQFMNWVLWNNGAWDYAADTRGYTNGFLGGDISDKWSIRAAVYQMPSKANGQDLDAPLSKARSEDYEVTLSPNNFGTVVRVLAYRNIARMGIYQDALVTAAASGTTPDIQADDRDGRKKYGVGLNVEQPLADAGETGVFLRAGWNDGRTETFAFTEVDRTFTFGGQVAGNPWARPDDRLGIAAAINGLSPTHREYLAAGGVGFVLGDGRLNYAPEQILEAYYRIQLAKYKNVSLQLSPDFQYIHDPGYNRDRGPVSVASFRLHAEY